MNDQFLVVPAGLVTNPRQWMVTNGAEWYGPYISSIDAQIKADELNQSLKGRKY